MHITAFDQIKPVLFQYDIRSFQLYNHTGYSQLMATVTKHLLVNTESIDPKFSLIYIPMPTGKFKISFYPEKVIGSLVAAMIEVFIAISHTLQHILGEKDETKLELMLKRIGLTPKTEILTMATVFFTCILVFLVPFLAMVKLFILQEADLTLLVVFYLLYAVHHFLQRNFYDYLSGGYGNPITILMSTFQFFAHLYIGICRLPEMPMLTYVMSVWPYSAFSKLVSFMFTAGNLNRKLDFGTIFTEPIMDVYLGTVFKILLGSTVVHGLAALYIWPLKIDNKTLPWYYPCLCLYSRRSQNFIKDHTSDTENPTELLPTEI